jgi:hypothetical protein
MRGMRANLAVYVQWVKHKIKKTGSPVSDCHAIGSFYSKQSFMCNSLINLEKILNLKR